MAITVDIEKKFKGFHLKTAFSSSTSATGILGASGSGKSMTLRCIAGIEKPDRGKIVINGRTVFDSDQKINLKPQERRIGYLFQNYALFPTMSVRENIGCGYRGETAAQHAVWKSHTAPDVVERHVLATHTWQVAVTHKTADIIQIVALLGIGRADKIIGHFDGGCQHRTAIATGIELHAVLEIAVVALQPLSRIEFHREEKLVDGKIKVAFVFLERRAINPLQGNVHLVGTRTLRPALVGPFANALLPGKDVFFR